VLIVDDSPTICHLLTSALNEDPDLDVVGFALDAFEAREKIKTLKPDVLTLDVEMPRMDGVTFLKNLMRLHPLPVVMFSSQTQAGASATMKALAAGAVDFIPKPSGRDARTRAQTLCLLADKLKQVAGAQLARPQRRAAVALTAPISNTCRHKIHQGSRASPAIKRLVAIGASTGGPEVLGRVLSQLSLPECVLVIAQHMPENFMQAFADRLNTVSTLSIDLASDGQPLQPGHGYVAPGDRHLVLERRSDGLYWSLSQGDKVSGHRPSVNVLFDSLADQVPKSTLAVLMTGMGEDGASALKSLRSNGALTLIQDRQSSVVWGMPGAAAKLEAQDETLTAYDIAPAINTLIASLG
jgi:two-component system chemotaxis response regulator CheB